MCRRLCWAAAAEPSVQLRVQPKCCGEGQGLPGQWYLGMAVVVTVALNSALPCPGLGKNDAGGMP